MKTILCLANSRKPPSGRCIAGREMRQGSFGDWMRPVSSRPSREISEEERRYENGIQPRVLDVISIQMTAPAPELHQQENQVIDDHFYWVRQRNVGWMELQQAVEQVTGALWQNGNSSSYGLIDRVQDQVLVRISRSLWLIRPEHLRIIVATEGAQFGDPRRRVRAKFQAAGQSYLLAVTDPLIERDYLAQPNGEFPLDDAVICVSLGEVFHGFAHKLVAAVITPQRAI